MPIYVTSSLADVNGDGMMEEEEFCILHFLFDARVKGIDIPSSLPHTLRYFKYSLSSPKGPK